MHISFTLQICFTISSKAWRVFGCYSYIGIRYNFNLPSYQINFAFIVNRLLKYNRKIHVNILNTSSKISNISFVPLFFSLCIIDLVGDYLGECLVSKGKVSSLSSRVKNDIIFESNFRMCTHGHTFLRI